MVSRESRIDKHKLETTVVLGVSIGTGIRKPKP